MKDKNLERDMDKLLDKLEQKNDWLAVTPVRREISEHIVAIRKLIRDCPVENPYE